MRRNVPIIVSATVLTCLYLAHPVLAQSYEGPWWSGKSFSYRANTTSFVNNIGSGLGAGEYEQQIAWALSAWRERTGANISFTYGGSTTNTPNCSTGNSTNEVAALSGCLEPSCITWALTRYWYSGNNMTETDICVYGGMDTFSTALDLGTNKDLIGVLTHEFGHALGLGHTANTVMDSPTFNDGNTLARHPYGLDVAGIQHLYGRRADQALKYREMTATSWGSERSVSQGTLWHANAAVGSTGTGTRLVVATLDSNGGSVRYGRSGTFPLGSSPTWTQTVTYTQPLSRPPSVAGSDYQNLWVSASTLQADTLGCNGILLEVSYDTFDSVYDVVLPDDCTIHDPVVAYKGGEDSFILAYTRRAWGADIGLNDHVFARTSPDGFNWTEPVDLGVVAVDAPDLKCSYWACELTYTKEGGRPNAVNIDAYIDGYGNVYTGGTSSELFSYAFRTTAAGVRNIWSTPEYFMALYDVSTASTTDIANGKVTIRTAGSTTLPNQNLTWPTVNSAYHRASLAGFTSSAIEVFYVR